MSREEAVQMLMQPGRFGGAGRDIEKATAVYDAYSQVFPEKTKPIEIVNLASASRDRVVATADAKKQQAAPVYMALFDYEPNLFNGRMRAFHCADICYWFANTDKMVTHTGGGKEPRMLGDKMSNALLNFMRTGNPNCASLPNWPEYTEENGSFEYNLTKGEDYNFGTFSIVADQCDPSVSAEVLWYLSVQPGGTITDKQEADGSAAVSALLPDGAAELLLDGVIRPGDTLTAGVENGELRLAVT